MQKSDLAFSVIFVGIVGDIVGVLAKATFILAQ